MKLHWKIFYGILTSIAVKIIVDKGIIFAEEWNKATQNYTSSNSKDKECKTNYGIAKTFAEECAKANLILETYPISAGFQEMWKKTPTCIVIKCVDLLDMIINSWFALLLVTLSLSYFFIIFFKKAKRFTEEKRYKKYYLSFPREKENPKFFDDLTEENDTGIEFN